MGSVNEKLDFISLIKGFLGEAVRFTGKLTKL
jgi:hypothetical protein